MREKRATVAHFRDEQTSRMAGMVMYNANFNTEAEVTKRQDIIVLSKRRKYGLPTTNDTHIARHQSTAPRVERVCKSRVIDPYYNGHQSRPVIHLVPWT